MLFRSSAVFSALAFAAAAGAVAAPRAPSGKWNVDFADAQCIAHRDYGTAKGSPKLLIKAPALGDVMQVAILRDLTWSPAEQVDSTLVIDGGRPLKTTLLMYSPADSKQRIYLVNMPSADFALVRRGSTLSVRSPGLNETFALSQMEPLMKVVDECVADLKRVFNIVGNGPEATGLRSRARGNIARLFSSGDYPQVALRKGQTGRVKFAMLIQENGRVADCTIIATSGVASLDSQACAMVKTKAKFQPAIGNDGKPAKDAVVGSISWRL